MSGVERQDAPTFDRTDGEVIAPYNVFIDGGDHLNAIPWDHVYLHEGITYSAGDYQASLANNGVIEIVLTIGASLNAHTVAVGSLGGDALGEIYEGVTIDVAGSAIVPNNLNREVVVASSVTVNLGGTIGTGSATLLEETFIPGGTGGVAVGNIAQSRAERVLKRSTLYLYRLTNLAGTAQGASLDVEWYEHLPVGTGVS